MLFLGKLSIINTRCLHPIGDSFLCLVLSLQLSYAWLLLDDLIRYIYQYGLSLHKTSIYYYCVITAFFFINSTLFVTGYFSIRIVLPILSSFFFMIRKCLLPNNGEVTSLIHCSSDKLSAILEARRPPPWKAFLPRQPFASAFLLVLLPFTIYTRMARANRLISQDLIWCSIKIFAGVG